MIFIVLSSTEPAICFTLGHLDESRSALGGLQLEGQAANLTHESACRLIRRTFTHHVNKSKYAHHVFIWDISTIRSLIVFAHTVFVVWYNLRLWLRLRAGLVVCPRRLVTLKQRVEQHNPLVLVKTVEVRVAMRRPF